MSGAPYNPLDYSTLVITLPTKSFILPKKRLSIAILEQAEFGLAFFES
jgi:hypothetical protein